MAKTLNDRKLDAVFVQAFCLNFDFLLKQYAKMQGINKQAFNLVLAHQLLYYNSLPPAERMNLYANNSKVLDELLGQ